MQEAIIEHHQAVGLAMPPIASSGDAPVKNGERNYRYNKRMGMPLRTDDELYLVFAATVGQTSEVAPAVFLNYALRFLITD